VEQTEEGMATNIRNDMSYLEAELKKSPGKFLFGDTPTAADTMMHFSAVFILKRELGMKGQSFPEVERYIKDCEATETYKRAVEKTGHQL
jgi:glutathione S-transferase